MKLVPIGPPGPNARKARAFASEIRQLRAQGYTFEAIREALAGAGVHVSNSTVQREVARAFAAQPLAAPAAVGSFSQLPSPVSPAPMALQPPPTVQSTSAPADRRNGKEIAEAFVRNQSTNPLVRAKEHP